MRLELLATPSLDAWGLGLTIYELFSSGGAPLFPFAHDASHLTALAEGTLDLYLGVVTPVTARHLLEKLLELGPTRRAPLDDIARHAWLVGGLDTMELSGSFSGLQREQELTQRQLGRVQASIATPRPGAAAGGAQM